MNTTENDLKIRDTINIDATTENNSKTKALDLWKAFNGNRYQLHVTFSSTDSSEKTDDKVIYLKDLKKRKEVYGVCGECSEPGTGSRWCQPCNAKRFEENFKNWTSGNKDIDEVIQQSQLDAIYTTKFLQWVPFENFQDVTYITRGGFGEIYSANWPEGPIVFWNIKNKEWQRRSNFKAALKSLDNSSDMSTDFLNEIRSHLHFYFENVLPCFGITQNPDTKNYMMILPYCHNGNLRNWLNQENMNYKSKINNLFKIAKGLLDIHNAGKVHKDFHSGNILFDEDVLFISDLGMCQPASGTDEEEGNYGVLPYIAPEVLCGNRYTKAADIYSFGIIMSEFFSEKAPYNNISHDHILTVKICKGFRPTISEDTPKLLADLIMKCWDAKAENRPTANELRQILKEWVDEVGEIKMFNDSDEDDEDDEDDKSFHKNSEICSQIEECEKIRLKNSPSENKPNNTQTHPQAIYTSRLLSFKDLPMPANSECFDCQI